MVTRPKPESPTEPAEKGSGLAGMLIGLLFVAWVGEWSVALDPVMYNGLWRSFFVVLSPLFEPVPGIRLFTWQLLLFALVPLCLARPGAFKHRARELDRAILVSLACVAITFLWGWARGGSPYYAYYQVWRWLTALLVAYLLVSAMRSPRDLVALARMIVLAALIRATLCIYFYWAHIHNKVFNLEYLTNHDDSVLFVTATLIVGCWAVLQGGKAAWTKALLVVAVVFYAMVLNDRRIAWMELFLGSIALYVLIGASPLRRQITRWGIALAPLLIVYVVLGWGSDAAFFKPVQSLASAGSNYDPSSLARQEEIRNLLYTLGEYGNPLFGTGWGHPYQKLSSIYSNFGSAWLLAGYTPHNSLLGVAVFSGFLGVIGIWGVIPAAALLAARGYRKSVDPIPRAAAMVAIGVLVAYGVHSFGDIGFNSFTPGLFLGVALATAAKVSVWGELTAADALAAAPAAGAPGALPATYRDTLAARLARRPSQRKAAAARDSTVKPGRMPMRPLPRQ